MYFYFVDTFKVVVLTLFGLLTFCCPYPSFHWEVVLKYSSCWISGHIILPVTLYTRSISGIKLILILLSSFIEVQFRNGVVLRLLIGYILNVQLGLCSKSFLYVVWVVLSPGSYKCRLYHSVATLIILQVLHTNFICIHSR